MRRAIFDEREQAEQAATHLQEQGFHASVGVAENMELVLTSDDAQAEPFETAVTRRYGRVITGTTE